MNLCEILKGHEGETFYSPVFGIAILKEITNDSLQIKSVDKVIYLCKDGKYDIYGECMLFPSKNQRDWNKWIEEQKPKVPETSKTWSDSLFNSNFIVYELSYIDNDKNYILTSTGISPIEKSALALLKIHQLIEVGYGGNVTNEEWLDNEIEKFIITLNISNYRHQFTIVKYAAPAHFNHIAFHTKEQAEEFLSYPENIQLLKDYFMLPVTVQG